VGADTAAGDELGLAVLVDVLKDQHMGLGHAVVDQMMPPVGRAVLVVTATFLPIRGASAALVPGYFDSHGWGFGVSVVTRRIDQAGPVGRFGWDGGLARPDTRIPRRTWSPSC
jgi:hypothetical protein